MEPLTFEGFFAQHYEKLFRAMWLVSGNREEGEEMAQEAMARVCERWDKVSSADRPDAYLFKVALNLNHRRIRRLASRPQTRSDPQTSPSPEEQVEFLDALSHLPISQRRALVATEWLGLSSEEASSLLGTSATTVRTRAHRAREELRKQLGGS